MTDAGTATSPPAAPPAPAEGEPDEGGAWGRIVDGAGIIAGVVLAVIVVDIFTDGRFISRRLGWGRRGDDDQGAEAPPPESGPAQ